MSITNIIGLLGGLGLFLYGMTLMSNGLETAAGDRLKGILERLTANRFVGVGVGALVAALTQSSSATTVMAIGFVNSGLMNLQSAVWIIMGANIGTTITGQLIALNISAYAPILLFIGVALIMFMKSLRTEAVGHVLIGLGMLFMGLEYMSTSMEPLRTMPEFTNIITQFQNPLIGILVGAVFTAIIQSSSASVGILQSLALSGVITLPSAIYVLFGQNIGTCITAVLASVGAERNAKRATLIHLLFNIIGTVVFVTISLVTPFATYMASLTPNSVPTQIANVHTVFNIVTTLLLLPFGRQLVELTFKLLPDKVDSKKDEVVQYLDFHLFEQDYHVGTATLVKAQLFKESQHMLALVSANVQEAFAIYDAQDFIALSYKIRERENQIDHLNQQMVQFTAQALAYDGTPETGLYVKVASDLERIGDHAMNIMERFCLIRGSKHHLSEEAVQEMTQMRHLLEQSLALVQLDPTKMMGNQLEEMTRLEQLIDTTFDEYERHQITRLKHKACGTSNSVHFAKVLTDFERIGDHCLNIAESMAEIHPNWQFVE